MYDYNRTMYDCFSNGLIRLITDYLTYQRADVRLTIVHRTIRTTASPAETANAPRPKDTASRRSNASQEEGRRSRIGGGQESPHIFTERGGTAEEGFKSPE